MPQIKLNHLSTCEYLMFPQGFVQYKQAVIDYLQVKRLVCTDQDREALSKPNVISHSPNVFSHSSDVNSDSPDVIPNNPERFVNIGLGQWLDIWANVFIAPEDPFFDVFFAYRLRQLDILQIDQFMDNAVEDNITLRYLSLVVLKHETLYTPLQLRVINQWLDSYTARPAKDQGSNYAIKGRPKREADDNLTLLSQEQTALLIHYLQKAQAIFKGDYLTNKQAGESFSILTGYSANTLRQSLGELSRIADKRNLNTLYVLINQLAIFIQKDLKETH